MFCYSWIGTNPHPFSLFYLRFPPLCVFLWSVVTGAKLISPSLSLPAAAAILLAPSSFLRLPLSPSDTLLLFTSDHICIYLSPRHSTSLLLSMDNVVLTAKPLEKRLRWKPPSCMRCPSPKKVSQIRLHPTLCIQTLYLTGKDAPCNSALAPFKYRRQWVCSRNNSRSKDFFPQKYSTSSLAGSRHRLTSPLKTRMTYTHRNTHVFALKGTLQF